MASRGIELTPSDVLTGLPLPILSKSTDYYFRRSDYHHHFHPKDSVPLGYTEAGKKLPTEDPDRTEGRAVRQSRGQYVPIWLHSRYHDIFEGPVLPGDSRSKFTAVILSCAGVVPRQAIDLYKPGEYRIAELSNRRHSFAAQRIYYEGAHSLPRYNKRDNIGRYIATYALNNSLKEILNEDEIARTAERFLDEPDPEKKLEQGKLILAQAVDASTAELIDLYRQVKSEGMATPNARKLGDVALDYFPESRFGDYVDSLELQLQTLIAA